MFCWIHMHYIDHQYLISNYKCCGGHFCYLPNFPKLPPLGHIIKLNSLVFFVAEGDHIQVDVNKPKYPNSRLQYFTATTRLLQFSSPCRLKVENIQDDRFSNSLCFMVTAIEQKSLPNPP